MTEANIIVSVCIDYFKAFDTVEHKKFLSTLEVMGLRGVGNPLLWIYMEDRQQFASLNGEMAKHGVPQGSMFWPLLYTIYVVSIQF